MDTAALIASFATGTAYVVTRTTRSTLKDGKKVAGTESSLSITASISPATGNDLKKLPEGRRSNETKRLITTTLLFIGGQVGSDGGDYEADVVTIGSEDWQVEKVATWQDSETGNLAYDCLVQVIR